MVDGRIRRISRLFAFAVSIVSFQMQRRQVLMNKERFLRIFMVICVLFAVSRADSDNTVNGSGMEQTMTNTERGNGPNYEKNCGKN